MLRTQDMLERLNAQGRRPADPATKLNELVKYIAENYSENEVGGNSMEEVVFAARNEILKTVVSEREKRGIADGDPELASNNGPYKSKGNWTVGFFLQYPRDAVQYLLVQGKQQALKEGNQALAGRFQTAAEQINDKRYAFASYETVKVKRDSDMQNLKGKYIGENGVSLAFNANKAGFFEWFLRRTSRQYKDFEKAFTEYNKEDYDGINSRVKRENLNASAKAYLMHKIPGYNGKDLPRLEDIERLSGKSKSRAMFCYNVLKSTTESKELEQKQEALSTLVEDKMKKDGTNSIVDKLYKANTVDPKAISDMLNDVSPVETVVGINGETRTRELTDSQKDFQKSLARDLDDKPNGVNVKQMYEEANVSVDHGMDISVGE